MPKGGSRKGIPRGNAKPNRGKIRKSRIRRDAYDTPNALMRDAVKRRDGLHGPMPAVTEHRIQIARLIHAPSGDVRDMTPREVLLDNMHYSVQAAYDWQAELMKLAAEPQNEDTAKRITEVLFEVERYRMLASEDAYKVAPYIHPRLAAVAVGANAGISAHDIVQALLDDIDARQRDPRVIEHQTANGRKE